MTHIESAALLALLSLRACTSSDHDPIHAQFERRTDLASCGELELDQGETLDDRSDQVECLRRAWRSGGEAELTVREPTTEGDPIVSYHRVVGGHTEVYVDSTSDAYSDKRWLFATCARPTDALDVSC